MKAKFKILLFIGALLLLIAAYVFWYYMSIPRFKADDVSEIVIKTLPSPPNVETITTTEDINAFVEVFNTFKISPALSKNNSKGWTTLIIVSLKNSQHDISIEFKPADSDSDYQMISIDGRTYKTEKDILKKIYELL